MSIKVTLSYETDAEKEWVISRLRPLIKRIRYQPKKPNSPYYRAYVDLRDAPKGDTIGAINRARVPRRE